MSAKSRRRRRTASALALAVALARVSGAQEQATPDRAPVGHAHPALMQAWLGSYDMGREASGTSWQPEAAGMDGVHLTKGAWRMMAHAFVFAVETKQGSPRGGRQAFVTNMFGLGAARPVGRGTLAFRAMASLEPLMGRSGYRHLLQTGESADGVNHLIDRQHPHDAAMELAAVYSRPLAGTRSVFVYAGWPGEPALGPPAFMHRSSATGNPTAPLGHHWMDATHITFGVVTGGLVWGRAKIDASAFNGREPDGQRWDLERPRLDSASVRLTLNPSRSLSAQVSAARVEAPERLHPTIDVHRYSASVAWSGAAAGGKGHVLAAWGRNARSADLPNCFVSAGCSAVAGSIPYPPARVQDALLVEGALQIRDHVVFGRAERVEKDGLYPGADPFHARVFPIGGIQLGSLLALPVRGRVGIRAGAAAGWSLVPEFVAADFGGRRPFSFWIMAEAHMR